MDLSWTPQQKELFEKIEQFASAELNHDLVTRDRECRFNREGWKRCGENGIQGLAVPVEYGGR